MTDPVTVTIEHIEERGKRIDDWLEERRRARERNEEAEVAPYRDFQLVMAEGDKLEKEAAWEVLRKAGVSRESFERGWEREP